MNNFTINKIMVLNLLQWVQKSVLSPGYTLELFLTNVIIIIVNDVALSNHAYILFNM